MAARKKATEHKVDKEAQKEALLNVPGIQALDEAHGAKWTLYHADCVDILRQLPDGCLDYAIYSPPFTSLYVYSESERDMGNTSSDDEFLDQYRYLAEEITRCLRPGRLITVHCKELSHLIHSTGHGGVRDFPGELTRIHEQSGLIYHGRRTIWKDPVVEMQRTKAHRLLYKELRKDSTVSGNGMPDYLLHFRKWPKDRDDVNIERVEHTKESFTLDDWQKYASPVWMDIQQTDTLNVRMATDADDERHMCPLQLPVIRRCLKLHTNPGDVVLSPFAGIGSEGYVSIQEGCRFIGTELKRSYFEHACRYLREAEPKQLSMFPEAT